MQIFDNREDLWIDTFLNLKNQEINLLEFEFLKDIQLNTSLL